MSVIGFDLGYQGCHIAIIKDGGVEVITNEYSERRSLSLVAFGEKQRLVGHSAKNQETQNFRNTIHGFRELLGRKFSDPWIQNEIRNLPFAVVPMENDAIGIKVNNDEGEKIFSPEQITAMMLTYLKKVAQKALGKVVADCVISVPSYFTDPQRRALLDASAIAGLNCLRLFNDTTAAALAYGIYKQDLPAETEKPRNVVFVDMGHSSLQASVCSFQKGKLNVIAKASDSALGGRNFDHHLLEYFADSFKKKYKIDVFGHPKRYLRLMGAVEKVKKTMSSVATPVPLNIECFADDKDVSGTIKRETFVELCAELLNRVKCVMENALVKSKLSLTDIDAVEVIGGSCRVPAVKEILCHIFRCDLSTTLNLDEAVSRGCALQCAMLSPAFKVRDFTVNDIQPYSIQLKWQTPLEGENGDMVVFKEQDAIFHSKMLTFYRKETFDLQASYCYPDQLPYPCVDIGTFKIMKVTPTEEGEASKIKIKVRMNIHGIFYIKDATLVEKQRLVELPPPPPAEPMEIDSIPSDVQLPDVETMTKGEGNKPEPNSGEDKPPEQPPEPAGGEEKPPEPAEQPPEPAEQPPEPAEQPPEPAGGEEKPPEPAEQPPEPAGGEGSGEMSTEDLKGKEGTDQEDKMEETVESGGSFNDSPNVEKKETSPAKPPEAKKPKKPTYKYTSLPITSLTPSLNKKQLDRAHEIEVNLDYQDELEQEKSRAKNALEEYVYLLRDRLLDDLANYITEEDKAVFSDLLAKTEDWLYDEGEDQPKKVYVDRLEELRKSGDPVEKREREFQERPGAFNELGATIIHFEKILESYDQGVDLYNHIDQEEMNKVREQVKTKRLWLETQMQACQAIPKHATAPISCAQVRAEAKNLTSSCNPIVTKSKPKPKEEPPEDDHPAEAPPEEVKMEEDSKPAEETTTNENTNEMDLD